MSQLFLVWLPELQRWRSEIGSLYLKILLRTDGPLASSEPKVFQFITSDYDNDLTH